MIMPGDLSGEDLLSVTSEVSTQQFQGGQIKNGHLGIAIAELPKLRDIAIYCIYLTGRYSRAFFPRWSNKRPPCSLFGHLGNGTNRVLLDDRRLLDRVQLRPILLQVGVPLLGDIALQPRQLLAILAVELVDDVHSLVQNLAER